MKIKSLLFGLLFTVVAFSATSQVNFPYKLGGDIALRPTSFDYNYDARARLGIYEFSEVNNPNARRVFYMVDSISGLVDELTELGEFIDTNDEKRHIAKATLQLMEYISTYNESSKVNKFKFDAEYKKASYGNTSKNTTRTLSIRTL